VEGGFLGYPGASTVVSQPPWLANPHNPAMMKQWKGEKLMDGRGGGGKTPQSIACLMKNSLIIAIKATMYHVSLHV